jgi:hypothetical protein
MEALRLASGLDRRGMVAIGQMLLVIGGSRYLTSESAAPSNRPKQNRFLLVPASSGM